MVKQKTQKNQQLFSVTRIDPYSGTELPFTRKIYKKNTLLYLAKINDPDSSYNKEKYSYVVKDVDPKTKKDKNQRVRKYSFGYVYFGKNGKKLSKKLFKNKKIFETSKNAEGNANKGFFIDYLEPNTKKYTKSITPYSEPVNPTKRRFECLYVTGNINNPIIDKNQKKKI